MNISIYAFSYSWLTAFFSYLSLVILGIYSPESDDLEAFYYLFVCFFALLSGIIVGKKQYGRLKFAKSEMLIQPNSKIAFLVYFCCVLGFLGGIIFYSSSGSSFNISDLSSLENQRDSYLTLNRTSSLASYLTQYFTSIGIIGGICLPWIKDGKNHSIVKKMVVLILYLIGYLLTGLATGGRINIFAGYLPLFVSIAIRYRNLFFKNRVFSTLILVILFTATSTFAGLWTMYRSSSFIDTVQGGKEIATIYTSLKTSNLLTNNIDIDLTISYILHSVLYSFSNGIYNFEPIYLSYSPHPLFGQYQFSYISALFTGSQSAIEWFKWKEELESTYLLYGRFWNVWGTFVREFVMDFGVLVTPIFCFLTGNIIALIEKYCFSSLETYILYVLSISWLIWSIFYSFFVYRNFQISFFLTLFFFLIKFVYSKSIKSRKQVKRKKNRVII